MSENQSLELALSTFYNVLEPLEEYIGKLNCYSDWNSRRQLFRRTIADSNYTEEGFEDTFLTNLFVFTTQMYCCSKFRNKSEYIFICQEVQKEFYKWIDATKIKADNCPSKLKIFLFTINEILEGRGEKFIQETREFTKKIENSFSPNEIADVCRQVQKTIDNPPNLWEVKLKGDSEVGKEAFQQIANSLSEEEKENFHFYAADYYQQRIPKEPEETSNQITEEIKNHRKAAKKELEKLMEDKWDWFDPENEKSASQQLIDEMDKTIKDLTEFRNNTTANGGQNKWAWKELDGTGLIIKIETRKILYKKIIESLVDPRRTQKTQIEKKKKKMIQTYWLPV